MPLTHRLKRLRFRAEHRGTKEADMIVGGFFAAHSAGWSEAEVAWYEALMDEQDVDILAWALAAADVPAQWQGDMMTRLQRLDYVPVTGRPQK